MLLNSLQIQSYRGLEKLHFDALTQVGLIVGENNTGKSSILEAIALLLRPMDPGQWIQVARQRDTDADLVDALWSGFRSDGVLRLDEGPQHAEALHIQGEVAGELRKLGAAAIANEGFGDEETGLVTLTIAVTVDDLPVHDLVFRPDDRAQWGQGVTNHKCFTLTPATHRSGRQLLEHLSRAVDEGEKALALELLQLFDPQIQSLDVSGGNRRETIVVKHKERGVVHLSSFGDGMRRVAALALALSRAQGGVLLIDELEAGIHPSALEPVMRTLVSAAQLADVQLIATTHSLEAVDATIAATTSGTLAGYYLTVREGARGVRRYDHERLRGLREAGVDLR